MLSYKNISIVLTSTLQVHIPAMNHDRCLSDFKYKLFRIPHPNPLVRELKFIRLEQDQREHNCWCTKELEIPDVVTEAGGGCYLLES